MIPREEQKLHEEGEASSLRIPTSSSPSRQRFGGKLVTLIQQALEDAKYKLRDGSSNLIAGGYTAPKPETKRCPQAIGIPDTASTVDSTWVGLDSE